MWFDPTVVRLFGIIFWLGLVFALFLVAAVLGGTGYGLAVVVNGVMALHGAAP